MQTRSVSKISVSLAVLALLSGFGWSAQAADNIDKMTIEQLRKKVKQQQAEIKRLKAGKTVKGKSKNDLKGIEGEEPIRGLAKLGVYKLSLPFKPYGPISRGQFVAWLVRANNAIYGKKYRIRLARSGDSTFKDVPKSNPYWPYIQGLANSGFVVGFTDGTFKPNKQLTREEMIHLKVNVDYGGLKKNNGYIKKKSLNRWFNDWNQVDKRFAPAVYWDDYSSAKNISRVFGTLKVLKPKTAVTREEAATCIWVFGGHANSTRGYRAKDGKTALKNLAKSKRKSG